TAAAVLREPGGRARAALEALLRAGDGTVPERLKFAGLERTSSPADLSAVRVMARSSLAMLPGPLRSALVRAIEPAAEAFERGGRRPVELAVDPVDRASLPPVAAATWAAITEALGGLASGPAALPKAPAAPPQAPAAPPQAPAPEKSSGFLV